jgi:hypothetical protein
MLPASRLGAPGGSCGRGWSNWSRREDDHPARQAGEGRNVIADHAAFRCVIHSSPFVPLDFGGGECYATCSGCSDSSDNPNPGAQSRRVVPPPAGVRGRRCGAAPRSIPFAPRRIGLGSESCALASAECPLTRPRCGGDPAPWWCPVRVLGAGVTMRGVSVQMRESNPQALPSRRQEPANRHATSWAVAALALAISCAATDSRSAVLL